jgi:hypothetical protein
MGLVYFCLIKSFFYSSIGFDLCLLFQELNEVMRHGLGVLSHNDFEFAWGYK